MTGAFSSPSEFSCDESKANSSERAKGDTKETLLHEPDATQSTRGGDAEPLRLGGVDDLSFRASRESAASFDLKTSAPGADSEATSTNSLPLSSSSCSVEAAIMVDASTQVSFLPTRKDFDTLREEFRNLLCAFEREREKSPVIASDGY